MIPLGDYKTTAGRTFGFNGWPPGESPVELFDAKRWLECLHACMFAASRRELLEDDAILHELVHLALGIDICTHNTMDDLRAAVVALGVPARSLAKQSNAGAEALRLLDEAMRHVPYSSTAGTLLRAARRRLGAPAWRPIDTAPKDNKRALYLARFDEQGKLVEIDFDGVWEYWQESWELAHINGYAWMSAGSIENPTHWAYQDEVVPGVSLPADDYDGDRP